MAHEGKPSHRVQHGAGACDTCGAHLSRVEDREGHRLWHDQQAYDLRALIDYVANRADEEQTARLNELSGSPKAELFA